MTTWSRWLTRRARASRALILTQLLLVVLTTGIVGGALGWSDATATSAARSALVADGDTNATVVEVRMRLAEDPKLQDRLARELLTQGFAPAPVSIVTRETPDPSGGTAFVTWVVAPDVANILPEHLRALADGAGEATDLTAAADLTGRGITVQGDLAPVAGTAAERWSAARSLGWVPLGVLVVVTVLTVAQVAGLLAAAREQEVHLLLARGARPGQLLWSEFAESTAVTGVGTVVGLFGAVAVVQALSGALDDVTPLIAGAIATGALIVVTLAITTGLQIRRTTNPQTHPDRVRAVAGAASALAVASAAGVSLWQLRRTGSVVVAGTEGQRSPDLVAVAAPALLLLAAGVLGLLCLGPLSRLIERVAHRCDSAVLPLAASQVSRRLSHQAVSVVLTILAVGTSTLASLFSGTASALQEDHRILLAAADVRVAVAPPVSSPMAPRSVPEFAGHSGVTASVPVWLDDAARIGDMAVTTVAAPLSELSRVIHLPRDHQIPTLSRDTPSEGLPSPLAVPAGTSTLKLALDAAVSFDQWQEETIRLGYDYGVALARADGQDPTPDELRSTAVQFAGELWRAATTPLELEPALFVRDLDTGQAELVRGGTLTLQPGLALEEADLRNPTPVAASGSMVLEVALDPAARIVVDAIHLSLSDDGEPGSRTLEFSVGLVTDGGESLAAGSSGWTANHAIPASLAVPYEAQRAGALPARVEVTTWDVYGFTRVGLESNKPQLPPTMDTTAPAITWRGDTLGPEQLRIAPGQAFVGHDPLGVTADPDAPGPAPVPVALTRAAAQAAQLDVGDAFQMQVLQRAVPVVLTQLTDVVPAVAGPRAAILDSSALAEQRSLTSATLPWPQEVWVGASDPQSTALGLGELEGVEVVAVGDDSPGAGPVAATATTFWVAAGGSVLLMGVGVGAAALSALNHRRPEVAVLRALGMGRRDQALSRGIEIALALWPAALFGMLAGWLVGLLVVGSLASSAVPDAGALVPVLEASWPPLAILLGVAGLGVGLVHWAVGGEVAQQAGQTTYREEVR